jgi:hypothetical protein
MLVYIHEKEKMHMDINKYRSLRLAVTVVGVLLGGSLLYKHVYHKLSVNQRIVQDMAELQAIFSKINHDCKIIGFEQDKNYITFLNVKSFAGSTVGSMKLAHPEKWEGPYASQNPSIDGKSYYILKHNEGYFIVPGDGVMSDNGKIFGDTVKLTPGTPLASLIQNNGLTYKGMPLIVPLELSNVSPQPSILNAALVEGLIELDE